MALLAWFCCFFPSSFTEPGESENDNSETTRYAYQDNGWLQTKTLANGVVTSFTRDHQGRLTDLANKTSAGAVLSDFSVPATGGYDGVGNRLSVTASLPGAPASYSGTTSYAYDYGQSSNPLLNRSQLTGEASTRASGTFSYGYDGSTSGGPGNPTSFKGQANTFNSDNQITSAVISGRSLPCVYDGNGNPTTYKSGTLAFDPENRLINAGSNQADAYDGDGLRTWKQSGNNTGRVLRTYFLYDGDLLVSQYSSSNGSTPSLSTTSTYGADGLVSVVYSPSSAASTFYTFDERGNVAQRLDKTAAVVSSDLYDAYGARTSTSSATDFVGFGGQAGYYTDSGLGLILCTHRYYDPQTGRWLTRDPIGYRGGVNLYGYCGNDPVNQIDPSGNNGVGDAFGNVGAGLAGAGFGWGSNPGNWFPISGGGTYTGPTPIININPPPLPAPTGPIIPLRPIFPVGPPITITLPPIPTPVYIAPGPIGVGVGLCGVVLMGVGGIINLF